MTSRWYKAGEAYRSEEEVRDAGESLEELCNYQHLAVL
jgi:hypothetical protein